MNEINFLLNNRNVEFLFSPQLDNLNKKQVQDKHYIQFLKSHNGGLFFNKSLQMYGYTDMEGIYSLDKLNEKINVEYGIISVNSFFFACDVFGNQFCFDNTTGEIFLFNIETGNREFIANNFIQWIQSIALEIDYYTGQSFIIQWEEVMGTLNYDERLMPKYPFALGGEYHLTNIRAEKLTKILEFNSSIAKQIFDLPDGTRLTFKFDE